MTPNNKIEIPHGYKDSALGIIPQEWEVKRLGEVVDYKKGFAFKNEQYKDNGVRIIRISDTDSKGIKEVDVPIYLDVNEYEKHSEYTLHAGDIVVRTVGSRPPLYDSMVGKTIAISDKYNGCLLNQNMVVLYPKDVVSNLLFGTIKTDRYIRYIESIVRGNANQVSITLDDLFQFQVIIPPLAEQKRIAEVLDEWDKAIELQAKLVERLQTRKRALMQQLLTPLRRLPNFTQSWQKVKLGEIATIKKGVQVNKIELGLEGKYPTINGGIEPSGYSDDYNTAANTITISEGGNSCGYVSYITTNFWRGGHCYAAFEKSIIYKIFLFQILKYKESEIMALRVGSGLPNIQIKPLEKFKLTIPSLDEQKAIAEVLSEADNEIAIADRKLTALRTQKRALMQQLLTGKKRLKI